MTTATIPMNDSAAAPFTAKSTRPPFFPSWNDPRIPFACILSFYAILGCTVLGFNRNPIQILLTVFTGCALEVGFHRLLKRSWIFPLSAYISCVSLSLLLNYSHNYFLLFLPVFFTIASKYIFTFRGRHIFNPSLFGVFIALKFGGNLFASAPAYQWGGSPAMAAFIVTAALALFVFRIGRTALIASFLGFYALQLLLRLSVMRWHLPPETLIFGTITSASFYLFTFFMLTDPKTSPNGRWAQVGWSFGVVALDLWFHTRLTLSTLFFALFAMSAFRWGWLHARAIWRNGFGHLRSALFTKTVLVNCTVMLLIGSSGFFAYTKVIHPTIVLSDPGFKFEPIPESVSGITSKTGNVLNEIDPRVQHFAKWLTSVGDAIAVGDFDNDGLLDIFLTNPLKRPEDRNALYRNLGGWHFERVEIPCLHEISQHPEKYGLVAGALFVDYDNSGAQSLLLCNAYGKTRLLKNKLIETGKPEFVDVTEEAGVAEHTVCVAGIFFDYDRDGKLDLLLANNFPPELRDYKKPTPFTIFKLPQPEYDGDRRMFHFMHESWHNAENAGINVLFHNEGGGKFAKTDIAKLGMPDTHFSIALGTADLNHDGYTDVYVANDFGPDDLYLNDHGKSFVRVAGKIFGSISRDTYKGMNVSIGDLDNRGWQDIYVSNVHEPLQAEGSLLWKTFPNPKNAFVPNFEDEATTRGALNEHRFGWGAAMGDLNLDGWLDIVQANGMVDDSPDKKFEKPRQYWYFAEKVMRSSPNVHSYVDRWPDLRGYEIFGHEADRVYLSRGARKTMQFVDVASQVGVTKLGASRGMALVDFDNDGDLDLAITHQFDPLSLYRNTLHENAANRGGRHHWLGLSLQGDGKIVNREAVGTHVTIRYQIDGKPAQQSREVQIANGLSAQNDRRLLFGLGNYSGPIEVEVNWYGGRKDKFSDLILDRYQKLNYTEPTATAKRNFQKGGANLRVCSESPQRFPTFLEISVGKHFNVAKIAAN